MSKIIKTIDPASFEYVRDRLLEILVSELDGQYLLTYDVELDNISVYLEKNAPVDKTELSSIIISLAVGTYSNKNQGSVDGSYMYHIDVFANSKTSPVKSGDTASSIKLQKIMRVCRGILEDPIYKTLGFVAGFILKTYVSEFNIAPGNKEDALNSSMGRISFTVVANESSKLLVPSLIAGYETTVKIDGSGKGYFYEGP